ncbi:uncharacterized protein LOC120303551 [Crotalus tigris]|uniref:uncharacterized protein LOC120303551 n=1 Tax=Crotalus tigris TaxID=88082 RepID=UPI00192F25A7|nr:uncharacterized protein LOC120303551 [Crotalus tigris]
MEMADPSEPRSLDMDVIPASTEPTPEPPSGKARSKSKHGRKAGTASDKLAERTHRALEKQYSRAQRLSAEGGLTLPTSVPPDRGEPQPSTSRLWSPETGYQQVPTRTLGQVGPPVFGENFALPGSSAAPTAASTPPAAGLRLPLEQSVSDQLQMWISQAVCQAMASASHQQAPSVPGPSSSSAPTTAVRPPLDQSDSSGPRLPDQLQKEPDESIYQSASPGSSNRHGIMSCVPVRGETQEHQGLGSQGTRGQNRGISHAFSAPGQTDLMYSNRAVGSATYPGASVVSSPIPKTAYQYVQQTGSGSPSSMVFPWLVDFISRQQRDPVQRTQPPSGDHGHQSLRLGGSPPIPDSSGSVVASRSQTQHKLVGAQSDLSSSSKIPHRSQGPACTDSNRQRGCKGPREPAGGHTVEIPHDRSPSIGHLGRETPALHQSRTHFRGGKSTGRFPQQVDNRSFGVDASSRYLQGDISQIRQSDHGPVCLPGERSASQIPFPVPFSGSRGNGCTSQQVATRPIVCLPPIASTSCSNQEAPGGTSGGDLHRPLLAQETMVRRSGESFIFSSMEDSRQPNKADTGKSTTSRSTMASTDRLALERRALTRESYSAEVIAMIQAARRPATNRLYDHTWKHFGQWCDKKHVSLSQVMIPRVLEYLMEGVNKGLAPNTLRRQLAALSSILSWDSSSSLSRHPAIRAFLKGVSNTRPPVIHRYPSWNLPRVLQALISSPFEPLKMCSLRHLSFKVSFLIAITSARRISELAALLVRKDLCTFHEDRVVLRLDPSFIPKVNTVFHRAQEVILPNFCPHPSHELEQRWHTLDIRRALRCYIKHTKPFRKSETLFVSFQPSSMGQKVSVSTIGRWIRACISSAYVSLTLPVPPHVTAHSTRSAATTAAWATQASIEDICRAATWSSPSPFIRHYRLDKFASAEAAFGRRILQQVVTPSGGPAPTDSHP